MMNLILVMLLTPARLHATDVPPSTPGATLEAPTISHARRTFVSRDGLDLTWVVYPSLGEVAHPIVIAPGCGESIYRYDDLVGDLRARGYGPIYILEHRSQGASEGTGVRDDLVHVDRFEDYVHDFIDFVRGPVATDLAAREIDIPPDLIAHSMGGAIAALALARDAGLARRVAFVAPMLDINTSILNPMNDRLALWAAEALCLAGFGERLAVGGLGRARKMKIPGVPREVSEGIFRGAVTPGWLKAAIPATIAIRRRPWVHDEPSLVVLALRDRLVSNPASRDFAARAGNATLLDLDGAHGLHHDPRTTKPLVEAIDRFFGGCESSLVR